MASTDRTVRVRYVVVDTRKGIDLVVRHDLKDALQDCDALFHTHIRREVEISWDNITVISRATIHIATLITHDGYAYCNTHQNWYDTQHWSCCEQCWKNRK
jgi:ABC-type Na+ transport system ATPase subunit NatA